MNAGGPRRAARTARPRSSTCSSRSSSTTSSAPRRSARSARCGCRASTRPSSGASRGACGVASSSPTARCWPRSVGADVRPRCAARAGARGARAGVPGGEERVTAQANRTGGPGQRRQGHCPPGAPASPGPPRSIEKSRCPITWTALRAFSSVGQSAALTRRMSGVRVPQRPRVVAKNTTFPQVTRANRVSGRSNQFVASFKPRLQPRLGRNPTTMRRVRG